jgi:hypothetical protein
MIEEKKSVVCFNLARPSNSLKLRHCSAQFRSGGSYFFVCAILPMQAGRFAFIDFEHK